jgi:hypothetical protein
MRTTTFLAGILLIFASYTTYAQQAAKGTASRLNGAWESDDKKAFTVIHDGYFNSVGQDSSGNWASMHAGTLTVNADNTVTFKVLYSSYPSHVGSLNTAEYSLTGEKLMLHHFKKLIDAEGKDITEQMPKDDRETMTRLK